MHERSSAPKRVTLTDVAKIAGVSIQTASHVLSGNQTVRLPESTRSRVKAAALQIGYRPNPHAQAIRRGRTNMISVWMPLDRPNLLYLHFLHNLSLLASETSLEMMVVSLNRFQALGPEAAAPQLWPVDGILSIDSGKAIQAFRKDRSSLATPVAILGYEEVENGDSVAWDIVGAVEEVVNKLIAKGCRRIAHVTLSWVLEEFPNERRRRAYTQAMQAAGLQPEFIGSPFETRRSIAESVTEFIEQHGCPDAFFGFTDLFAMGAARAVRDSGRSVPDDCLIWGFGDMVESDDYPVPISTIQMPMQEACRQSWDWLMERIASPGGETKFRELSMKLIERESSIR